MGGSLPGKAFEQVKYASGLAAYKDEIRAKLPGWQGFSVVRLDGKDASKQKERREKQVEMRIDEVVGAPLVDGAGKGVGKADARAQPVPVK